jgi:hypothetical protein
MAAASWPSMAAAIDLRLALISSPTIIMVSSYEAAEFRMRGGAAVAVAFRSLQSLSSGWW